jgi:hypothetical protein
MFKTFFGILSSLILKTFPYLVAFEVLTAVSTKMAVFWVVAPCSMVEVSEVLAALIVHT